MSTPTTFGVIGTGWRSDFFQRVAQAAPDRLRVAGVVSRSTDGVVAGDARRGP